MHSFSKHLYTFEPNELYSLPREREREREELCPSHEKFTSARVIPRVSCTASLPAAPVTWMTRSLDLYTTLFSPVRIYRTGVAGTKLLFKLVISWSIDSVIGGGFRGWKFSSTRNKEESFGFRGKNLRPVHAGIWCFRQWLNFSSENRWF